MSDNAHNRDSVQIDENVHHIYKQLSEGGNDTTAPFRTMKDVFMWAACLGVRYAEKQPLTGKRIGIFRWAPFSSQIDVPLLKAIAISHLGRIESIGDQNTLLTIVEEYANYGIHHLARAIIQERGQPLWNLVSLLGQYTEGRSNA